MNMTDAHIRALKQRPVRPIRYWLFTRWRDRLDGRRDADAGLAHDGSAVQPSASLRRLQADVDERCQRLRFTAITAAAPLTDRTRELSREREALKDELTGLDHDIARAADASAAVPVTAAATERHLTTAQVAARRAREASGRTAPLRTRRNAIKTRLRDNVAESAGVAAKLDTLWDGLQANAARWVAYYEKRAQVQVRAYLRRIPAEDGAIHPLNTRSGLNAPEWVSAPSPWTATIVEPLLASTTA